MYQPPPAFYDDVYQNWAGRLPSNSYPYDNAPRYDLMAPPQRSPFGDQPLQLPPGGTLAKLGQAAPPANRPEYQPSLKVVSCVRCGDAQRMGSEWAAGSGE